MLMLLKGTKMFPCSALFRALIGMHGGPVCAESNHTPAVFHLAEFSPVLGAGGRLRRPLKGGGRK